jgi:hypothetical protein
MTSASSAIDVHQPHGRPRRLELDLLHTVDVADNLLRHHAQAADLFGASTLESSLPATSTSSRRCRMCLDAATTQRHHVCVRHRRLRPWAIAQESPVALWFESVYVNNVDGATDSMAVTSSRKLNLQDVLRNRELFYLYFVISSIIFYISIPIYYRWHMLTRAFVFDLKKQFKSARTRERRQIRSSCRSSTGGVVPRCAPSVAFVVCGTQDQASAAAAVRKHVQQTYVMRHAHGHYGGTSTTLGGTSTAHRRPQ